ncbi:hypothetical protein AAG906_015812 [Vitis piasezkii]
MLKMKETETIKDYSNKFFGHSKQEQKIDNNNKNKDGTYPPCPHCKRQITHKRSVGGGRCQVIFDVLYVPNIDQNLLSVRQLIEKGFKVIFEDKWCMIKDTKCRDVFKVKMRAKSFALNLMEDEQITFSKGEPRVFIGYRNSSKAYRIFQPQNGKILVSRDVKFMEDKQWNWEESIKMQAPDVQVEKVDKWIEAMKEELRMIEKNDT